ncbi:MAG: formate dehydrogenase subunit gamma [Myxococcota bacterium]
MSDTKLIRGRDGTLYVERFSLARRLEHLAVITCVVLLVLTGFPQRFYDTAWAQSLLSLFGGLDSSRTVHRVAGFAFSAIGIIHILVMVVGSLTRRFRPTMLPTPKDLQDASANLRYYLGFRDQPPKYPKFDYRQKFEYIGMVMGGLIMIVTGIILFFPVEAAAVLPGQWIAASHLAHSNEALLALMVLVVWHVYGASLSPEVFPLDTSMFNGRMSVEELRERHALEYERLFPNGLPELDGEDEGSDHGEPCVQPSSGGTPSGAQPAAPPLTRSRIDPGA